MTRADLAVAATCMWALLLLGAVAAAGAPRSLSCPPSIIKSVTSCSGSGSVSEGNNVTYAFSIEEDGPGQFDLVFVLRSHSGDADLVITTPSNRTLSSALGSGEDWVLLPRRKVEAGNYLATVVGSSERANFKLTVERHEQQTVLDPSEREALQQILDGPCCKRQSACASLRGGLDGFEGAARDLCNTGLNRCDAEGRLLQLALVNEYLACPFPKELSRLSRLELLDLSLNDLTGSIQDVTEVTWQMPGLQALHLPHNRLGGQLSCELLGKNQKLAALDLSANEVQGSIPQCLVESPEIQELYLSNNRLSGPLPAPPPTSKLVVIAADSMRLVGSLPDMSALQQLQALLLHNNGLIGALPPMPPSMRLLNLEYNKLSGSIPNQWASLDGWEVLRLRHNRLTGTLPAGLAKQPELELLLANHNGLTGAVPQEWATPQLLRLDLQHNNLTGPLPASLGALPSLAVLQAGTNALSGGLQAFAQAASGSSTLQVLALNNNQLEGPVPDELQSLPLFGGGFVLVDGVSIPATLELSANRLSGPFPSWVAQELVDSSVVVSLEGNSLECPEEVPVSQALPSYRLDGLECVLPDGTKQSIASLLAVQAAPGPAGSSGSTPEGSEGSSAAPSEPASADASGSGGSDSSSGGSGLPGWAIALITIGSVAAAAGAAWLVLPRLIGRWQVWRSRRYESYEDGPATPGAAYAAKQRAVALSQLGAAAAAAAGKKGGGGEEGGAHGAYSAWGGTPAAEPQGEQPFSIGTKVHADGSELV